MEAPTDGRVAIEQFEPAVELTAYCALAGLRLAVSNSRYVNPTALG